MFDEAINLEIVFLEVVFWAVMELQQELFDLAPSTIELENGDCNQEAREGWEWLQILSFGSSSIERYWW